MFHNNPLIVRLHRSGWHLPCTGVAAASQILCISTALNKRKYFYSIICSKQDFTMYIQKCQCFSSFFHRSSHFHLPAAGQILKPHSLFHHDRARNTFQPLSNLHRAVNSPRSKTCVSAQNKNNRNVHAPKEYTVKEKGQTQKAGSTYSDPA